MSDFIPNRSKQAVIPFQKVPNGNKDSAKPTVYTYRDMTEYNIGGYTVSDSGSSVKALGIYPDSYELALQEDLSIQHLYHVWAHSGEKTPNNITYSTILSHIPAITIREYIPDTRLNSTLNYMTKFFSIIKGIFEKSKDNKSTGTGAPENPTTNDADTLFDKVQHLATWAFDFITGTGQYKDNGSLWTLINTDDAKKYGNYLNLGAKDDSLKQAIFNFPFTMYYLFQSSLTTNIYEFPCITSDNKLYSSTGHEGWTTGSNEFSITGLLGKIPIAGTLLKNTLNNISVNYLPWWDAEAGHRTAEPEITVKFHLFNDNISKAVINFICVNTLIANNKWYQYNLFQHSSCLYEIKLDGYNRLFACTCNATVKSVGNLRTPPESFTDMIKAHCKGLVDDEAFFAANLIYQRMVKIPDVYEVELTFKSILPANFNNFMYQYSAGPIKEMFNAETGRTEEQVTKSMEAALGKFKDEAIKEWNKVTGG